MHFELGYVPMPAGYGDSILTVDDCKKHLRVDTSEEDALISALRDASIEWVERFCGLKLGPSQNQSWRSQILPSNPLSAVSLAVRPVTDVTAITWQDGNGVEVTGDVADYRFSENGEFRPIVGGSWPAGVGGEVEVTFDAGFAEGECPPQLLHAVRLMIGHLYANREAVIVGAVSSEVPLGITTLCMPYRPVML